MSTPSAERSLHHCSFMSEKIWRAVDKLATILTKACCQVSRCLLVMLEQGDLSPMSPDHQHPTSGKIHVETQKMSKSGFFWNDKKSRLLIQKHEFQADCDRRNIQKLNDVIQSQRSEIYGVHQGNDQHRRDQQLLHEQLLEQNRELRETHEKSLNEMEELKRIQGSTFDTIAWRTLIEDRDTIFGTYWQDTGIAE